MSRLVFALGLGAPVHGGSDELAKRQPYRLTALERGCEDPPGGGQVAGNPRVSGVLESSSHDTPTADHASRRASAADSSGPGGSSTASARAAPSARRHDGRNAVEQLRAGLERSAGQALRDTAGTDALEPLVKRGTSRARRRRPGERILPPARLRGGDIGHDNDLAGELDDGFGEPAAVELGFEMPLSSAGRRLAGVDSI